MAQTLLEKLYWGQAVFDAVEIENGLTERPQDVLTIYELAVELGYKELIDDIVYYLVVVDAETGNVVTAIVVINGQPVDLLTDIRELIDETPDVFSAMIQMIDSRTYSDNEFTYLERYVDEWLTVFPISTQKFMESDEFYQYAIDGLNEELTGWDNDALGDVLDNWVYPFKDELLTLNTMMNTFRHGLDELETKTAHSITIYYKDGKKDVLKSVVNKRKIRTRIDWVRVDRIVVNYLE